MNRSKTPRFVVSTLVSCTAAAFLLTGCASKKAAGPKTIGGLGSPQGTPAHTGAIGGERGKQTIKRAAKAPMKASALIRHTTNLAAAFKKNPGNAKVALEYVYRLRSLGMQQQSVNILYKAYQHNAEHPIIASEYGRLLLGSGKITQARRILNKVADSNHADWQTLSALGTLEAREGKYDAATAYFTKARELAPKRASILNNLALSLALGGKPAEAENLLRNADDSGRFGARLRQNLALVLALQGKYDEAQGMATTDLPPEQAQKNIAYLKRMLASENSTGIELSDNTPAPRGALHAARDSAPATTGALPDTSSERKPTSLTPAR